MSCCGIVRSVSDGSCGTTLRNSPRAETPAAHRPSIRSLSRRSAGTPAHFEPGANGSHGLEAARLGPHEETPVPGSSACARRSTPSSCSMMCSISCAISSTSSSPGPSRTTAESRPLTGFTSVRARAPRRVSCRNEMDPRRGVASRWHWCLKVGDRRSIDSTSGRSAPAFNAAGRRESSRLRERRPARTRGRRW